jgi:hypothetical protein
MALAPIIVILALACSTERSLKPNGNKPPDTHLFLHFSETHPYPGETTSKQVLYWYGDDPDGEVVGFEWAWDDTSAWNYTISRDSTFFVPITVPQDTFTFYIRAIDNQGMRDPTPDHISFPIRNSPPAVSFPLDLVNRYGRVTYNCFSYFSISWVGSDPDGDATITGYEWYLADSSFWPVDSVASGHIYWNQATLDTMSWGHLDSLATYKIFNDLQPGRYRFFMRCRDVAAAYSPIIYYPDTLGFWNVMPIRGNVLYVDDNTYFTTSDSVNINGILTEMYGSDGYSTWNVTPYSTNNPRISYYPRDIEATLKLFDKVIWNGSSYPQFRVASDAITSFLASGGHLFAFSTHARADTTIYPFLPIDSVVTSSISRIFNIYTLPGVDTSIYPGTLSSQAPLSYSYAFEPGPPSGLIPAPVEPLYYCIQGNDSLVVAARYPAVGSDPNNPIPAKVIYFSLYVFDCNLNNRFYDLTRHILQEEFEHGGN